VLRRAPAPKGGAFERLLAAVFRRARTLGLIESRPEATIDSTGLETRHVSRYFARKRGDVSYPQPSWPMLTVVAHVRSHLIAAAVVTEGPKNDFPFLPPALRQALGHTRFHRLLADAGYDSEKNHRVCREELGVESVIRINRRWVGRRWPRTPHRRRMRRRFPTRVYRRRAHAESVFSALKRTLGSCTRATGAQAQLRELLWKVLAFDLMILRRATTSLSTEPV
jgi:hypothetical protein